MTPTVFILFLMSFGTACLAIVAQGWTFHGAGPAALVTEKRRRWRWLVASASILLIALLAFLFLQLGSGIRVTIQNNGNEPLRAVSLHVTGNSYVLGDIPARGSASARVAPTSESHLEVEFQTSSGKAQRLNAGGYFEPGYRGTIHVTIKDEAIEHADRQVTVGYGGT